MCGGASITAIIVLISTSTDCMAALKFHTGVCCKSFLPTRLYLQDYKPSEVCTHKHKSYK